MYNNQEENIKEKYIEKIRKEHVERYKYSKKPLVFSIIAFAISIEFIIGCLLLCTPVDPFLLRQPTDVTPDMALTVILIMTACMLIPIVLLILIALIKGRVVESKKYIGFSIAAVVIVALTIAIGLANKETMIQFIQYM